MSTAKWQNIAGSKNFFSSNPAKENDKKVPTNNEKRIVNFEANFFEETSYSDFLGQK